HDPPRHLHSFPTRRSSDLDVLAWPRQPSANDHCHGSFRTHWKPGGHCDDMVRFHGVRSSHSANEWVNEIDERAVSSADGSQRSRSEEHTSELQSPYDLVCR